MPRRKKQSMTDRPVLHSTAGVSLTMRTASNGDAYWTARIRIRPYPTKTISELSYRAAGIAWEDARSAFTADIDDIVSAYHKSAPGDRAARQNSFGFSKSVEAPEVESRIKAGHELDWIMGCTVAPFIDPNSKKQRMRHIKKPDGSVEYEPMVHQVVAEGNIFDKTFRNLRYATRSGCHMKYYKYIHPVYGSRCIEDIRVQDIEASVAAARDTLGQQNLAYLKTVWNRICMIAVREGWITRDPSAGTNFLIMPQANQLAADSRRVATRPENRRVSDEEFRTVLKVIADAKAVRCKEDMRIAMAYRNKMLVHVLLLMRYCGLRPAEAFAIMTDCVKIDAEHKTGTLLINKMVGKYEHNKRHIRVPKTPMSRRVIALLPPAVRVLQSMQELAEERRLNTERMRRITDEAGAEYNNADFLFTDYYGNLADVSFIGGYISKLIKPLGIKNFSMYSLRHQVAADVASGHATEAEQMAVFGHVDYDTTLGYIQTGAEESRKALSAGVTSDFSDVLDGIDKNRSADD